MRKLALSDDILLGVEKPARYIGNEVNSVMKDKSRVQIRFAFAFPDVYEIGMSHLGISLLYDMLNQRDDIWCERVYSPWTDLDRIMRERDIPLFALESQDPVKDFDFLGITIQYEMCYTNILQILDLSKIPLMASERGEEDPIVIGGGPCTYNPEPLSDFFDLFYIGEGECSYFELMDKYKECKKSGKSRREFLEAAAGVPGIYVPSFYDVTYNADGTIREFKPNNPHAPAKIRKQTVTDLDASPYPVKPIVPFVKAVQDRVVLEIARGCVRGCRFCQAGMIYRPMRERSLERLEEIAAKSLASTGQDEISLSSLSSDDYSKLNELLTFLIDNYADKGVNVSLPSLRLDSFTQEVTAKLSDLPKSSLTFAPEAGSQRLRDVINKGITEDDILGGAKRAFKSGLRRVKLYFMIGLPTETEEDVKDIARLSGKIAAGYYDLNRGKGRAKCQVTVSTAFFIPKPFTPFQWAAMRDETYFEESAAAVSAEFIKDPNRKSIKYNWHDSKVSVIEGALARGDRKLGRVILKAYEKGCLYDSWGDHFKFEPWREAFRESDADIGFYNLRQRGENEIFPWDFIDIGVKRSYLRSEWEKALKAEVTPDCGKSCAGCGAASFGAGVCL